MLEPNPQLTDGEPSAGYDAEELPSEERSRRSDPPGRREAAPVLPFPARPDRRRKVEKSTSSPTGYLPSDYVQVGVSPFRVAVRLVQLIGELLYFAIANLLDWLAWDRWPFLHEPSQEETRELRLLRRRARRLRRILQRLGGTFIKIGQQMSIRTDVFHPVYCNELESLQDDAEPIPEAYVREVLARQTDGKPLDAVFAAFDFEAFGKASIACVYRAELSTGEEVAVKIRRPDIKRHFKTDLTALSWVLRSSEFLTILRPRISETFRVELELMLFEELDFHLERRYQELFRRYYKKRKKLKITAPKLFYDLCGPEVIVSEFVRGIWMNRLIKGVEEEDPVLLAELREQDIDPKRIAKHLVRGSHYGFFECPFFHGDPHPGNICVQPGNRIVLVDFGACGVFAERERIQLGQMHYFHSQEDVGGMVQCVINLMEPLPPIDLDSLRRRLENEWWKGFYGIKSKHAGWQERTSFRLWTALFREVRRFGIPMPLNVLRMIRATLLYDSVAARIYPEINVFKEYRKYYDGYAERIQREMQCSILRQLWFGPDPVNYVRARRLIDVGDLLLRQAQHFLRRPLPDIASLVSKGYEIFMVFIKWLFLSSTISMVAIGAGIAVRIEELRREQSSAWSYPFAFALRVVRDLNTPGLSPPELIFMVWLFLILFVTLKYIRQMWFRLSDKDIMSNSNGGNLNRGR